MAESKENIIKYQDAQKTHGFKGTAIPGAKGAEKIGAVSKGDLGVTFDPQAPYPQNIIVSDEHGNTIESIKLDAAALTVLRDSNRGNEIVMGKPTDKKSYITYSDAAAMVKQGEAAKVSADKALEVAQTKKGRRKAQPIPAATTPTGIPSTTLPDEPEPISVPKTKIKFIGPFGSISYPYTSVHVEGPYLIMVQQDDDGNFFEAPMSDALVEVQLGDKKLLCYSGPQFRLSEGGSVYVTVYLIDKKATGERISA